MEICVETATESFSECTEWADQGYEACDQWEDQGQTSCADWRENCCDWWPCSWGCQLVGLVCVAWVWVSNLVCVSYVWISNVVCVTWTLVTATVCVLWAVIEIFLIPIVIFIELLESIPIIGRVIGVFRDLLQTIIWRLAALPGALLDVIGIRPLKKMSLCIIVLRDENGDPTSDVATLTPAIDEARRILRDEAQIHLHVDDIHFVNANSPANVLDVGCNGQAFLEDLWTPGSYFSIAAITHCIKGLTSRVTGFRNQIVAFCVRDIPGGTAGCALGPLNDYLTIEGTNPVCLAHEIGHKVGLWHCCDNTNLANGICGGDQLLLWQIVIARNSKYVSYV